MLVEMVHGLLQTAQIFAEEAIGHVEVVLADVVEQADLILTDVFREQAPHRSRILGIEDGDEEFVISIALLATDEMAIEEQEERHRDEGDHSDEATIAHDRSDDDRDDEGRTSRDEPATDDRHHTRHTTDGTLTPPSAVCERRTHTYHEGDVRRGERELEGGTECDE